ncbi:MAG: hypothetical protein ACREFC_01340, partial [Stellaceae bacterium]
MNLIGDSAATTLSALVFLATGTLAFAIMIGMRARNAVRRRAARVAVGRDFAAEAHGLHQSGLEAVRKIVDRATHYYSAADSNDMKVLRHRLVQAGIYNTHAAAYFFLVRTGLAISLGVASLL